MGKKFVSKLILIFLLALAARLLISPFGTLWLDINTFIAWSRRLSEVPFSAFYDGWSDYLPGYLYVLWLLGKVESLVELPPIFLYKLPAIVADLLTGLLIYKIVDKIKGKKVALLAASLFLFNPAVIANSSVWGQTDSLVALFSLLTLHWVDKNWLFSAISLGVGVLIKPHTVLVAPVSVFILLRKKKTKEAFFFLVLSVLVFLLGFLPFAGDSSFSEFVIGRLTVSFGQYPYTSINAFNFWGLFGFWQKDRLLFQILGLLPVALIFYFAIAKKKSRYLTLALVFATFFLFSTRMHERHIHFLFAPLAVSSVGIPALFSIYLGFSLTYLANLYYSFNWITYDFLEVFSLVFIRLVILLNLFLWILLLVLSFTKAKVFDFKKLLEKAFKGRRSRFFQLKEVVVTKRKTRVILFLILFFSLVTRIIGLAKPEREYFDEVYHAFTAQRVLAGDPKAWEWWNTPPEGFAFEWTHPPVAKLAMALGMFVFGENSFGWRLPGALLGAGTVYLVYLITKRLFGDELLSLLSAFLFSLEGLALVMSRIGMNDTYFLFFSLLSLFLFIKSKYFFSAASFGLAFASKWSAVWLLPVLFLYFLANRKKLNFSLLWFVFVPPLIYLASYAPMFLTGHGLDIFWGMQKQMWWYHTGLEATHPYTSAWWSWPLLLRPIYLYTSEEVGGFVSRIYALGNPLIFWGGLVSIFYLLVRLIESRLARTSAMAKNLGLVLFAYFVFFVPWAVSPRIMFLYHYLPSLPFLTIAMAFVLRKWWEEKGEGRFFVLYLVALCTLSFVYFYPHWAGLNIPLWLDTSYYSFSKWR